MNDGTRKRTSNTSINYTPVKGGHNSAINKEARTERKMGSKDYAKLSKLIQVSEKKVSEDMAELKTDIVKEISKVLEERLSGLEKIVDGLEMAMEEIQIREVKRHKYFEPETKLVVYKLHDRGDDKSLLSFLEVQDRVKIIRTKRLPQKEGDTRPTLLKVEFEDEKQKI